MTPLPQTVKNTKGLTLRGLALPIAILAGGATTGFAAASLTGTDGAGQMAEVRAALKLRLPKTPIDSIACTGFGSLCEVTSKQTLFYIDRQARFLMVGRLYDMETRQDLTAARLLALNPDLLAAGGAKRDVATDDEKPQQRIAATRVSLAELPADGAIHWGPVNGPKVIVFSDFHCGYCKRLSAELVAIGARVEERPISIFGKDSRALSEKILCATDQAAALDAGYAGKSVDGSPSCSTKGLDANEAFARANGFGGTPVIVRPSDGAVLEGYRPADQLKAFLTGSKSTAPAKGN